jgi:hypothetical protein
MKRWRSLKLSFAFCMFFYLFVHSSSSLHVLHLRQLLPFSLTERWQCYSGTYVSCRLSLKRSPFPGVTYMCRFLNNVHAIALHPEENLFANLTDLSELISSLIISSHSAYTDAKIFVYKIGHSGSRTLIAVLRSCVWIISHKKNAHTHTPTHRVINWNCLG